MDTKKTFEYYDKLDDEGKFEQHGKGYHHPQSLQSKKVPQTVQRYLQRQDDSRKAFQFTYKAARFEEGWLLDSSVFSTSRSGSPMFCARSRLVKRPRFISVVPGSRFVRRSWQPRSTGRACCAI